MRASGGACASRRRGNAEHVDGPRPADAHLHAVVGLSIPGLPVFGIGRSSMASWGGRDLRAWPTDFVSLSPDDVAAAADEAEDISSTVAAPVSSTVDPAG